MITSARIAALRDRWTGVRRAVLRRRRLLAVRCTVGAVAAIFFRTASSLS
jgi:hypothetical protein